MDQNLTYGQALNRILESEAIRPLQTQRLSLATAINHANKILASPITARLSLPPFNQAAMDGYAYSFKDSQSNERLKITQNLPAGSLSESALKPGQAARILTGAPVPPGADTVIAQENTQCVTQDQTAWLKIVKSPICGKNIRPIGEDVKAGQEIAAAGAPLTPERLSLLAACGETEVDVFCKPKISYFSTGDELVPLGQKPKGPQIVDSNSVLLQAALNQMGLGVFNPGIARDHPDRLADTFKKAFQEGDAVITCGGVSVGDHDYVLKVFKDLGGKIQFWKVAVKPGKPFAFGMLNGTPLFALPGNPVSAFLVFEALVRPALLKMSGFKNLFRPQIKARAKKAVKRDPKRLKWQRVILHHSPEATFFESAGVQGSATLQTLANADGFAWVPPGKTDINPGQEVWVSRLTAGLLQNQLQGFDD